LSDHPWTEALADKASINDDPRFILVAFSLMVFKSRACAQLKVHRMKKDTIKTNDLPIILSFLVKQIKIRHFI
jgi:hypothetical protein